MTNHITALVMGGVIACAAACGDNMPAPPDAAPAWSCTLERNCAGSDETTARTVVADTEQNAELVLVNACDEQPCSGALDCRAVCVVPRDGGNPDPLAMGGRSEP